MHGSRRTLYQIVEGIAVGPSQREFFAIAQDDDKFATSITLLFADGVEVDNDGTVDADKPRRVERVLELADLLANVVRAIAGMDANVVSGSFNPFDLGAAKKNCFPICANYQAAAIVADVADKGTEFFFFVGASFQNHFLCLSERFEETLPFEGLQ